MQGRLGGTQQGHAVLATGHQQGAQLQARHQLVALGDQLGIVGADTDDGFEFGQIRRDQAGATIDGEILALRIGQHRDVAGLGQLDQRLVVLQRALAVVGQHQHLDPGQHGGGVRGQRLGIGVEGLFEVDADQLLVATHDAQLDDGRLLGDALEAHLHMGGSQAVGEGIGGFVLTGDADQVGRRAQGGDVEGDVGRATGTILVLVDADHGHRRLGGDPRGGAVPVAVEHHVANHQDRREIEARHGQLHRDRLQSAKMAAIIA